MSAGLDNRSPCLCELTMSVQLLVRNHFVCSLMELDFSKVFKTTLEKVVCLVTMALVLYFLKLLFRKLPDILVT